MNTLTALAQLPLGVIWRQHTNLFMNLNIKYLLLIILCSCNKLAHDEIETEYKHFPIFQENIKLSLSSSKSSICRDEMNRAKQELLSATELKYYLVDPK